MHDLMHLLENNRAWSDGIRRRHPDFFEKLQAQQAPQYLWVGCADSRVPANEIVGLLPGELFVHRNVANLVVHSDLNCQSVIQYAVEVLGVRHVIVCGHYGCGGVRQAMTGNCLGMIDNWLRHIKDVYHKHRQELDALQDPRQREDRLCELNVIEQVRNVAHSPFVQQAWGRGRPLTVHGWVYGLHNGLLRDLGVSAAKPADIDPIYRMNCPTCGPADRASR